MRVERFTDFVGDVHPDPDHLFSKSTIDAWPEIVKLADHYFGALGKTHCLLCGKNKSKNVSKSKKYCDACFTSNS